MMVTKSEHLSCHRGLDINCNLQLIMYGNVLIVYKLLHILRLM